ncbi:MAG: HD family phosphohydrolase [Hungatella sp.]
MKRYKMTAEELRIAGEWAADETWVEQKEYVKNTEYLDCVRDILDDPIFRSMDQYLQHGDTTCKTHCIQVSYLAYQICKAWGWDYRSAARAGLLHDLFLYDWHTHAELTGEHFHGLTHPRVAMNNAVRYFDLSESEKNMILRHMWPLTPIPPKYREGYALLYADKFCGLTEVISHAKKWFLYTLSPQHLG